MLFVNISSVDVDDEDRRSHSDFTFRLKKPLTDTVGFNLLEAVIPYTWYPVYDCKIKVRWNIVGTENFEKVITFPDGYYNVVSFTSK